MVLWQIYLRWHSTDHPNWRDGWYTRAPDFVYEVFYDAIVEAERLQDIDCVVAVKICRLQWDEQGDFSSEPAYVWYRHMCVAPWSPVAWYFRMYMDARDGVPTTGRKHGYYDQE